MSRPWTDDKDAFLADLDARIADTEAMLGGGLGRPLEPTERARAREALHWLNDLRDAVADDEADEVQRVLAQLDRADHWVRQPAATQALIEVGAIADDPTTGTITFRPELVPDDQRDVAMSALRFLADIYWHRSVGGRPPRRE